MLVLELIERHFLPHCFFKEVLLRVTVQRRRQLLELPLLLGLGVDDRYPGLDADVEGLAVGLEL